MITKETKICRYCCFHASNFHLEMILLPYIKNNLHKAKIVIVTEEDLSDSIQVLIERINIEEIYKKEILNLGWNNSSINNEENNYEKNIFIINGDMNYINKINNKINNLNLKDIHIVDCYNISKKNIDIQEIKRKYKGLLNTEKIEW